MGTINYAIQDALDQAGAKVRGSYIVTWPAMTTGDVGQAYKAPQFSDKSIEVLGTFGGGTVTIEGSNLQGTVTTWHTLRDPSVAASLTFAAAGLKQVLENTVQIRPNLAGGAASGINVVMLVSTVASAGR